MANWEIALLVKPIVLPLFFFGVVAPVAWVLYRLFPNGRLKVFLFKVRDGPEATWRDRAVMIGAAIFAYVGFIALMVIRSP